MARVQELEHDRLVAREVRELLVRGGGVEERAIDILRQRPRVPRPVIPRRSVTSEHRGTRDPLRRDRAESEQAGWHALRADLDGLLESPHNDPRYRHAR
ncbi:hypothetical protein WMF34_21065 [Sorangium sp. So ce145]